MADYTLEQARFADWCTAFGVTPDAVTPAVVRAFLESEQPTGGTAARWAAAITRAAADAGRPDPCTGRARMWIRRARNPASRSALPEPEIADLAARIPAVGWTAGLFGRRNRLAFLLHQLAGIPGPELVQLRTAHLEVTGHAAVTVLTTSGQVPVDAADLPAVACPACAAVRHAAMLRHAADFNRPAARRALGRGQPDPDAHVCVPMEAAGPPGWPLFPAIDPRGYLELPPVPAMSYRAMKTLLHDGAAGNGTYRLLAPRKPERARQDMPEPPPEIRVAPPNPNWHADGVAARARDRDKLAEADAIWKNIEAEAARAAEHADQVLGRIADPGREDDEE
jgi:hypothetical protein